MSYTRFCLSAAMVGALNALYTGSREEAFLEPTWRALQRRELVEIARTTSGAPHRALTATGSAALRDAESEGWNAPPALARLSVKGRAVVLGDVCVHEGRGEMRVYERAILVVFNTVEEFRKAVEHGQIEAGHLCGGAP